MSAHWTNIVPKAKHAAMIDRAIREHYRHNEGSRRVRISRKSGAVEYRGSTEPTDRSHDYWHFGGERVSLARELDERIAALAVKP